MLVIFAGMLIMCWCAEATQLPSGEQLPVFASFSEALRIAGPNATAGFGYPWVQVNATNHLEVQVTPWESLASDTADFAVVEWHDLSNSFGLSLGPNGVTVFRALGGPAMDMLIICSLLVVAAVLMAFGFSTAGTRVLIFPCTPRLLCSLPMIAVWFSPTLVQRPVLLWPDLASQTILSANLSSAWVVCTQAFHNIIQQLAHTIQKAAVAAGTLFFSLGVLAVALQADYPFMSAFGGLSGDYSKAAVALSHMTAWKSGTLVKFWALSWLSVPLIVFAVVFWFFRAVRVRRLRRAHITRMLCNLNWVASCSRSKGASQEDGSEGETKQPSSVGKNLGRQSMAWTLGADISNKLSDTKVESIIKVLSINLRIVS